MSAAPRWRLGLVVGKFSPLHLGHELLIEHAMAHCRQVLVLGYSKPELPVCSAARRQRWVQGRFPQALNVQLDDLWVQRRCQALGVPELAMPPNTAPDTEQQNWLAWLLDSVLQLRPDAMFASEPYVHPTCERLSQQFGHPVFPVLFDPARRRISARASTIRQDFHRHRHALHPEVYQDFVLRVAVLGAESSGKTTLAQALAAQFNTPWVPEYGRELWEARQGQLTLADLADIAQAQVRRETRLCSQAHEVIFCDTTPLTTLGYAGWMFGVWPEPGSVGPTAVPAKGPSHPEAGRAPPTAANALGSPAADSAAPDSTGAHDAADSPATETLALLAELATRPYDLTVLCEPDSRPCSTPGTKPNSPDAQSHAFRPVAAWRSGLTPWKGR